MSAKIVAMILAGGKGTRLETLTKKIAKPAVGFAAKYRIIDFPLSNCANSGINNVGVLTQYESVELNRYIGNGQKWGMDGILASATTLPPRQTEEGASWYLGTADAIYCNIDYLDDIDPEYVLILSGDHIYRTTYNDMLAMHEEKRADCTIAVIEVEQNEASRFGIMAVDKNNFITEFQEKPKNPKSNLASMGIYIFTYKVLREALLKDAKNDKSSHDFGKDVIPMLLSENKRLFAYKYQGYWRDVGTIGSLKQANMDLLSFASTPESYTKSKSNQTFTEDSFSVPQYIGKKSEVKDSFVNQGAIVLGKVYHSVVSNEVLIEEDAIVEDSVIMKGAIIKKGAHVVNALVSPEALIKENEKVGHKDGEVVLISKEI